MHYPSIQNFHISNPTALKKFALSVQKDRGNWARWMTAYCLIGCTALGRAALQDAHLESLWRRWAFVVRQASQGATRFATT